MRKNKQFCILCSSFNDQILILSPSPCAYNIATRDTMDDEREGWLRRS
jgi:hypothetical protein